MSLLGKVEAAAAAGTPIGWIRVGWKALPWAAIAALTIALLVTRGQLDHVRMQAKLETKDAQLASAQHDLADANRTSAAVQSYADRERALQPIVVRSTDTVTRYAETPAGRASCLPADRLDGVQQDRDALFATPVSTANAGATAMSSDPAPPSSGRHGDTSRR